MLHLYCVTFLPTLSYNQAQKDDNFRIYTPNQPGATHTVWQSASFTPFFKHEGLLKYYDVVRNDVTRTERTVTLADQPVTVEIRRNTQFPNSGVTLFEIGGTSVVHNWQNIPEEGALTVLEAGVHVITPNDRTIIEEIDRRFSLSGVSPRSFQ